MKFLFTSMLLMSSLCLSAQCPNPILPKSGKTIQSFVPKGWFIRDSTSGDFNNDKLIDVVLVLANNKENENGNINFECARPLLILQNTKIGYLLSAYSKKGVLCKNCGGVFGDPLAGIELNKNVLNINHYAGSAWRWTNNYTFRFQNKKWELIGNSQDSFWNMSDCDGAGVGNAGRNLTEVNFSTSKMHIIKTTDTNCKPDKDTWFKFQKKPLVNLNQFNIDKNYLPIKA